MLKKVMLSALVLVVGASLAMAASVAPGFVPMGNGPAPVTQTDRVGLVNDGSFENGTCLDGFSDWTCHADNACDWIVDLSTLGLPTLGNFDGFHSYWLGGFCSGVMSTDGVCQTIMIDGPTLSWYWAGYVQTGGDLVTFTVDGNVVFSHVMALSDHTADGSQGAVWYNETTDISAYMGGMHELCLEYTATIGANYFVDYFEILPGIATEELSFSSVKSLY
jgi:hypothetical protein